MTQFGDVGRFHAKYHLPVARSAGGQQAPGLPDQAIIDYRLKFLEEELQELHDACANGDLEGAADALVDLAWVAMGTAHYFGLPFDVLWVEVRRANMSKVLATVEDPTHKRGPIEKIVKPQGWKRPDIDAVLQQEAEWFGMKRSGDEET